jgi:hypothetical protein
MTATVPHPRTETQPATAAAMAVIDALQTLAAAGWTITGVAEHVEHGVRVRATFSTGHHPTVGVSREVGGVREHIGYDSFLPEDPAAAVEHALDRASCSARWAVA